MIKIILQARVLEKISCDATTRERNIERYVLMFFYFRRSLDHTVAKVLSLFCRC